MSKRNKVKVRKVTRKVKVEDNRDIFEKAGDFIYEDAPEFVYETLPEATERFFDRIFGFDE